MQEMQVWSLTGAARHMPRNYRACAPEFGSRNYWAHMPLLLSPGTQEPYSAARETTAGRKLGSTSPQPEKARAVTVTDHGQKWKNKII